MRHAAVVHVLYLSGTSLSVGELRYGARERPGSTGISTIYRALGTFEETEIVNMMNGSASFQRFADRASISIAGVCAIHCFLAPAALVLFPLAGVQVAAGETIHQLMLLLILPASAAAMFFGCRRHKDSSVIVLGVLGISLLAAGSFAASEIQEKVLVLAGASLMVFGHLRNMRLCRKNSCER